MSTPSLRRGAEMGRTFAVTVHLPSGADVTFNEIPTGSTMDHFKAYCFRNIPELRGKPLLSYKLCVHPTNEPLSVDFVRVVRAHPLLTAQYSDGVPLELAMIFVGHGGASSSPRHVRGDDAASSRSPTRGGGTLRRLMALKRNASRDKLSAVELAVTSSSGLPSASNASPPSPPASPLAPPPAEAVLGTPSPSSPRSSLSSELLSPDTAAHGLRSSSASSSTTTVGTSAGTSPMTAVAALSPPLDGISNEVALSPPLDGISNEAADGTAAASTARRQEPDPGDPAAVVTPATSTALAASTAKATPRAKKPASSASSTPHSGRKPHKHAPTAAAVAVSMGAPEDPSRSSGTQAESDPARSLDDGSAAASGSAKATRPRKLRTTAVAAVATAVAIGELGSVGAEAVEAKPTPHKAKPSPHKARHANPEADAAATAAAGGHRIRTKKGPATTPIAAAVKRALQASTAAVAVETVVEPSTKETSAGSASDSAHVTLAEKDDAWTAVAPAEVVVASTAATEPPPTLPNVAATPSPSMSSFAGSTDATSDTKSITTASTSDAAALGAIEPEKHGVGTLLLAPHVPPVKIRREANKFLPKGPNVLGLPVGGSDGLSSSGDLNHLSRQRSGSVGDGLAAVGLDVTDADPNESRRRSFSEPKRKESRMARHLSAAPKKAVELAATNEWDFITYGIYDVRPVGSRPLAYSRIKIPVIYSDADLAYGTASVRPAPGWIVERPRITALPTRPPHVELTEYMGNSFFQDHFQAAPDASFFVANSAATGPLIACYVTEMIADNHATPDLDVPENGMHMVYKVLLRSREGDDLVSIPAKEVPVPLWRSKPTPRAVLRTLDARLATSSITLREITLEKDRARFAADLALLEQRQRTRTFKFGILYARDDQSREEDMFCNPTGSPAFERFLDMMGERVRLQGWQRFRAGLDVATDTTGTHSVYTTVDDFEIMFHVSTLLPFKPRDLQQLERKRHIGNDICVVVYRDRTGATPIPIPANLIKSEYIHIMAIVEPAVGDPNNPDDELDRYSITVCTKDSVRKFTPALPGDALFRRDAFFRDILVKKLINGENACGSAPVFESKLVRTRTALYKNFVDSFGS